MDFKAVVSQFFLGWAKPELTMFQAGYHTGVFLKDYLDMDKLGPDWGYTTELALEAQLVEYCREVFEYSDPREGESA